MLRLRNPATPLMSYFRPRRRRLPPNRSLHCPMCEADLRAQAMELVEAGYYVAAAATARCDLEWNIQEIARGVALLNGDEARTQRAGSATSYLRLRGIVSKQFQKRVDKVLNRAAGMIHRGNANCMRAKWMVFEVASILDELRVLSPHVTR